MALEKFDQWTCLTCPENPKFPDVSGAMKHTTEKHGYISGTPAQKNFKLHLDYRPGYESHYEWDFGSFKLYQKIGAK